MTADPAVVAAARAAILPGDGAFAATMRALVDRGLDGAIRATIAAGRPFLGICVGMQLLFDGSDEYGDCGGLGYFSGKISRLAGAPRVPHMGWNALELVGDHPFVAGIVAPAHAYFLHSYRAELGPETQAAVVHGERFTAIAARDNVMGTQFHPEKSQLVGAQLLDNFLQLADRCG